MLKSVYVQKLPHLKVENHFSTTVSLKKKTAKYLEFVNLNRKIRLFQIEL